MPRSANPRPIDAVPDAPRRRTGRPKNDGPRVGADELVRQCVSLLDVSPPAKVTFSALARHAKVTPALINYYFKDRSELMLAVLRYLIDEINLHAIEAIAAPATEHLREFIADLIHVSHSHPYFDELLIEQMVEAPTPAGRAMFEDTTNQGIAIMRSILVKGEAEGTMRAADPIYTYVSILGMCVFVRSGRVILQYAAPDKDPSEVRRRYVEEVFRMAMSGLAAS